MSRTDNIKLRVEPEVKALAEQMADADGRSLSGYIVALIRADAAKRGLLPGKAT